MASSEEMGGSAAELESLVRDTDFFRSLVENGSDAIVSIDENSTILYANQAVERVFGYEPEELVGEKLTVIMPERFQADHFESVQRYLETGERQLDWNNIRLPALHKDGHEVTLSITFEEHSYEGKRIFSGIMRDISERVEQQRELERQNERLEQFASLVSHDLRDPLQAAKATTAVAKAGDEEALEELDEIHDRMERLIEDVLSLAKQGQAVGETEPVDLREVSERAWSTADTDGATLTFGESLPTVSADPERLEALFGNLFRNAVEHGRSSAADDPATLTVEIGPLADGEGFYVADDGTGFGDTDADQLFEYGYTTNEDGTGFGLSIVAEIAEAHGWEISATESASGGARFEVRT
ncbi:PAS domain S-box protein [Halovenus sp. WSH3]|uniref:histidine kinase n=1 Tax=Halovenus carboxidivorans TaxID=2692199 RepID=A0A6B0TCK1_9EURY|nr:PAS domain-containing sensor histidine kinase [Halovenus carboxidivorans]MXR50929.1 PAS domain S-box protein [Halovenus carboxidivorans]